MPKQDPPKDPPIVTVNLVDPPKKKPRTEKPGRIAARHFDKRCGIQEKMKAELERHAKRMAELNQELEVNDLGAMGLPDDARVLFEKWVGDL